MYYLFEQSDILQNPVECFVFDTAREQFPVKPHWHYFAEIILIEEGSAELHSGDERFFASEGDFIFFHPQAVHSIYSVNREPLKYSVLKFDLNKLNSDSSAMPRLRSIFRSASTKKMPVFFRSYQIANADFERHINDCISEINGRRYGYDLIVRSRIYSIVIEIVRLWQEMGFSIDSGILSGDDEYGIESVTEYIDEYIRENLQVSQIAEKCGLSYSCFAKKFLALYGISCKEYIERMRIFKVEELLLFTDFDMSYISQETGFSDCSHMIKSFSRYRGTTPYRFRLANKEKH